MLWTRFKLHRFDLWSEIFSLIKCFEDWHWRVFPALALPSWTASVSINNQSGASHDTPHPTSPRKPVGFNMSSLWTYCRSYICDIFLSLWWWWHPSMMAWKHNTRMLYPCAGPELKMWDVVCRLLSPRGFMNPASLRTNELPRYLLCSFVHLRWIMSVPRQTDRRAGEGESINSSRSSD